MIRSRHSCGALVALVAVTCTGRAPSNETAGDSGEATAGDDGSTNGDAGHEPCTGSSDGGSDAGEVVVCDIETGAWSIGIVEERVYWITGSTAANCLDGTPCGSPGLWSAPLGGAEEGELVLELEATPKYLAAGSGIALATTDALVEVFTDGSSAVIDAQPIDGLATGGDFVYWAGAQDSTIWMAPLPGASETDKAPFHAPVGKVLALAATDEFVVWAEHPTTSPGPGPIFLLRDPGGEPEQIAQDQSLVFALVAVPAAVYWATADGDVFASYLDADGSPVLVAERHATGLAADADALFLSFVDGSTANIQKLGAASSRWEPWLEHDASVPGATPVNLTLDGDFLYWSAHRIFRSTI